jgi:Fungal specific transcription factor domain/Fungal Zn(2)-Cys(6) binuclear cluster domain
MTSAEQAQSRQHGSNLRQKRRQVARACDGCRTQRIKCDDSFPCSNCKAKGQKCTNNFVHQRTAVSTATHEIDRLKQRVLELEAALERAHKKSANLSHQQAVVQSTSYSQITGYGNALARKGLWEGVLLRPTRSPNETWFGPSSLYHYIYRMSRYLGLNAKSTPGLDNMLPASKDGHTELLSGKAAASKNQLHQSSFQGEDTSSSRATFLSPTQEGYFIELFWEGYHTCFFPILHEADFKAHYQSLWNTSGTLRKPSALADMVIAVCMQYGVSILSHEQQSVIMENMDATMAGRWYYQRAQTLLAYEADSPTISTLQCHLLCAVYLCGASFHNITDNSSALAARTAYMLGLHLASPQSGVSEQENQLRQRLWSAVCVLDAKVGMKLGRPFLTPDSQIVPVPVRDNFEASTLSGSTFAPIGGGATWLSFHIQNTKLYMNFRAAHQAFYDNGVELFHGQTIWDDPRSLEAAAQLLDPHIKNIQGWVNNVPTTLKTKRQHNMDPFGVNFPTLEIEQFVPQWLQRQRIILELTYHHLCVYMYRPFISFVSKPLPEGLAESYSRDCVAHAIALSNITHQVLSTTSILNGWHDAFQWQWNAAMTIVGYMLVQPQGQSHSDARRALDLAAAVFDIFKTHFSIAGDASNILRNLCTKFDQLHVQKNGSAPASPSFAVQQMPSDIDFPNSGNEVLQVQDLQMENYHFNDLIYGMDNDLFDLALNVDFWANLDDLLQEVN